MTTPIIFLDGLPVGMTHWNVQAQIKHVHSNVPYQRVIYQIYDRRDLETPSEYWEIELSLIYFNIKWNATSFGR